MKTFAVITAVLIAGASGALAATGMIHLTGSADFKVTKGKYGDQVEQTETRFFRSGWEKDSRVFKVTTAVTSYLHLDGNEEKTTIEAFSTKKNLYDTKAWTFKAEGSDFELFSETFVMVTRGGCCGSDDIDTMINIESGKQIVAAVNESAIEMEIPNTKIPKRYFAQIIDTKAPAKRGTKGYIGTIGYFTADRVKGIARIYANVPAGWGASLTDLKMIMKPKDTQQDHIVTLWSAEGAKDVAGYNDVGLGGEINYDSKHEKFSIMIDQDQISTVKSTVTSDLEIEIVNAK